MREAGLKVVKILLKDSSLSKELEKDIKLYYKNDIPEEVKDILTVVLPVAKIVRNREIILIDLEF
jgi:hypothetical protein